MKPVSGLQPCVSVAPPFCAHRQSARLALVSVGAGNSYGLPNDDVLERLSRGGAEVLRTDRWGTIVVRADSGGRRLAVEASGETWVVPAAGSRGS